MWVDRGDLVATYVICHVAETQEGLSVYTTEPIATPYATSYDHFQSWGPPVPWALGGWPAPQALRWRFGRDSMIEQTPRCLACGRTEQYEAALQCDGHEVSCSGLDALHYEWERPSQHLRVITLVTAARRRGGRWCATVYRRPSQQQLAADADQAQRQSAAQAAAAYYRKAVPSRVAHIFFA